VSRLNASVDRSSFRVSFFLKTCRFCLDFSRDTTTPEVLRVNVMQRGEVGKAGQGRGWEEMRENSSKAISFDVCVEKI